jgi:hypothetical protein
MNLDLTDEETAALLRELDGHIDGDRHFMSRRIKTLKAMGARSDRSQYANRCRRRFTGYCSLVENTSINNYRRRYQI